MNVRIDSWVFMTSFNVCIFPISHPLVLSVVSMELSSQKMVEIRQVTKQRGVLDSRLQQRVRAKVVSMS